MIETLESISWWLGRYGGTIGLVLLVVGVGGAALAEEVIACRHQAKPLADALSTEERAAMDAYGAEGDPSERLVREAKEQARGWADPASDPVADERALMTALGDASPYMSDPVRVCPVCGHEIELVGGLIVGVDPMDLPACPSCAHEMRWSEWDLTVQARSPRTESEDA